MQKDRTSVAGLSEMPAADVGLLAEGCVLFQGTGLALAAGQLLLLPGLCLHQGAGAAKLQQRWPHHW